MKRADFLALVLASVVSLKEKATSEELANLDRVIYPNSEEGCILGQMTGNYKNERANELATKTIYVDVAKQREAHAEGEKLQRASGFFGTSPCFTENILKYATTNKIEGNSPLAPFELFITMDGANTPDLVAFLKGEAETFEPTFNELILVEA